MQPKQPGALFFIAHIETTSKDLIDLEDLG